MTTTIPGVGPQMARAAEGSDPRGILTFHWLPDDMQKAEDSTAVCDRDVMRPRGFEREPPRPSAPCWRTWAINCPNS